MAVALVARWALRMVAALVLMCSALAHATPTFASGAPYTLTFPAPNTNLLPGQTVTITWTGGGTDPVVVSLIDVTAWTVSDIVVEGAPNTGRYGWTIPTRFWLGGPCGHTYQFYVQNVAVTYWTYGPTFSICGASVPPAAEQLGSLQELLRGMMFTGRAGVGVKSSLDGQLTAARNQLPSYPDQACKKLDDFLARISANTPTSLTPQQAATLTDAANALKVAISTQFSGPLPRCG